MSEPRYVVVNRDGIDTLHRNAREECNLDDTEADNTVDPFTAEAIERGGFARLCAHCYPDDQPTLGAAS